MKRPMNMFVVLLCLSVAAVAAQNAPMRIQQLPAPQAQPAIQPMEVQQRQDLTTDPRVVDPEGYMNRLEQQNRELRAENEAIKREKASVDARLQAMTTRGGSEVRAYCENPATSRNTAGASEACAPFSCNDVSGLCYQKCSLTTHCSVGACDVRHGICTTNPTN